MNIIVSCQLGEQLYESTFEIKNKIQCKFGAIILVKRNIHSK